MVLVWGVLRFGPPEGSQLITSIVQQMGVCNSSFHAHCLQLQELARCVLQPFGEFPLFGEFWVFLL